jgi:hypothetical protein
MAAWTTAEHRIAMTMPTRTAAELLNRSPEAIRKYRSRKGIRAVHARLTQDQLQRLANLRRQGRSWRVVGDMMGCSAPTARRAYRRLLSKENT